jgi:parvulin-like peptidyl-prolyl isomerase
VLFGASLAEVARSASDGATAQQGGQWDWTRRDSLDSKTIDDAIFTLPVAQLSPILEAADGYHIVRVVERQEASTTPFLVAQKTVKERIEKERLDAKQQEFLKDLREKYPFWTVFDASMKPAHDADDDDRYSGR